MEWREISNKSSCRKRGQKMVSWVQKSIRTSTLIKHTLSICGYSWKLRKSTKLSLVCMLEENMCFSGWLYPAVMRISNNCTWWVKIRQCSCEIYIHKHLNFCHQSHSHRLVVFGRDIWRSSGPTDEGTQRASYLGQCPKSFWIWPRMKPELKITTPELIPPLWFIFQ